MACGGWRVLLLKNIKCDMAWNISFVISYDGSLTKTHKNDSEYGTAVRAGDWGQLTCGNMYSHPAMEHSSCCLLEFS